MSTSPRYSIAVLTYNRPRLLTQCLESLTRITKVDGGLEIVVIDDGSAQSNASIVERFRSRLPITYHYLEHRGISAAKNAAVTHSRGEFVAIVADDYVLPKNYLTIADEFFGRFHDSQVLTFNIRTRGGGIFVPVQSLYFQLTLWQSVEPGNDPDFFSGSGLPASRAAIFRRSLFSLVGPFDEKLHGGEDYDLSLRMRNRGLKVYICKSAFIDHYEGKTLWFFLRQRLEYARNFLTVLNRNRAEPVTVRLLDVPRRAGRQLAAWRQVARTFRMGKRFHLMSPFLFFFLATFWWGVYRSSVSRRRTEAAAGKPVKVPAV